MTDAYQRWRDRYHQRRASRLCTRCPAKAYGALCEPCRLKNLERLRRWRQKQKKAA